LKRIVVALLTVLAVPFVIQASVLSCTGSAADVSACQALYSSEFNNQLDWGLLGPVGSTHTVAWVADDAALKVTLSIDPITVGSMVRADNTAGSFPGNFDPGDHLVGFTDAKVSPLLLQFEPEITAFGFRVAAATDELFNFTVQAFTGSDGITGLQATGTWSQLTGGGTTCIAGNCAAPFVGMTGLSGIHSLLLSSSDATGFYLDSLFYESAAREAQGTDAPEPSTWLLLATGGVALLWKRRSLIRS
jgi:hypothetical protein